jgi:hypothetical protein
MKRTSRKPGKLSEEVYRQLDSYALAAGVAGVGIMALAQPSEAKIVYTPSHIHINNNTVVELDLNHDGVDDFKIQSMTETFTTQGLLPGRSGRRRSELGGRVRPPEGTQGAFLSVFPLERSNRVVVSSQRCAAALNKDVKVGPNSPFQGATSYLALAWSQAGGSGCPWRPIKEAYLGVKFAISGKLHYGWARIKRISGNRGFPAIITGYAYESVANRPIITGKTKGPDVITVQDGTLGYLARGASQIHSAQE